MAKARHFLQKGGEEEFLWVSGGNVFCRRFGDGPGIPLLAIHGGPGLTSRYMEPLLDRFMLTKYIYMYEDDPQL